MAVIGMIGFNFPVTLAALAKINFHAGPSTFGLLTTALAVGALGGALAGSARRARPGAYVVLGAAIAFGVSEIAVGFAPSFIVAMILLVPTGFFSIYLAQAANHRVQMGVDSAYRGRVMALYVLVFLGTTPIGASLAGWWGEHFGVPSAIWGAGVVSLVAGDRGADLAAADQRRADQPADAPAAAAEAGEHRPDRADRGRRRPQARAGAGARRRCARRPDQRFPRGDRRSGKVDLRFVC